ncbi:unnamed protein product [Mytilus edulis]|uniref:Uncharacterized protein n=1 Tax=Mytilus edulis TaxID=6550 RepID=A0A8S3SML7_MYTED|nr:unnamed protein product [Mytilus edulis]
METDKDVPDLLIIALKESNRQQWSGADLQYVGLHRRNIQNEPVDQLNTDDEVLTAMEESGITSRLSPTSRLSIAKALIAHFSRITSKKGILDQCWEGAEELGLQSLLKSNPATSNDGKLTSLQDQDESSAIFDDQIKLWTKGTSIEAQEETRIGTGINYSDVEQYIIQDVCTLLSRISEKADRLFGNNTTNLAESWMHIRCKFDGGKLYSEVLWLKIANELWTRVIS